MTPMLTLEKEKIAEGFDARFRTVALTCQPDTQERAEFDRVGKITRQWKQIAAQFVASRDLQLNGVNNTISPHDEIVK